MGRLREPRASAGKGRSHERFPGVVELDDRRVATRNLAPGSRVYGETVLGVGEDELRVWDPRRSKLAAAILKGVRTFPLGPRTNVLYLGAANGTTASHVSDVCRQAAVWCVEFSPRAFRDLLNVCYKRPNMVPILADVARPETYAALVGRVDTLYMDVAQRDQAGLFLRNVRAFAPAHAMLAVKSRSIDVAREPAEVFKEVRARLQQEVDVLEIVRLEPFEEDHAMAIVRRR